MKIVSLPVFDKLTSLTKTGKLWTTRNLKPHYIPRIAALVYHYRRNKK